MLGKPDLFGEAAISLKDIFVSLTGSKKIKDDVDWNAGSLNIGFAMADLSIYSFLKFWSVLKLVWIERLVYRVKEFYQTGLHR